MPRRIPYKGEAEIPELLRRVWGSRVPEPGSPPRPFELPVVQRARKREEGTWEFGWYDRYPTVNIIGPLPPARIGPEDPSLPGDLTGDEVEQALDRTLGRHVAPQEETPPPEEPEPSPPPRRRSRFQTLEF